MTPTNLDYLQDSLKFLGFGERSLLNQHLETQVSRGGPSFELYTEAFYSADTKLEAKLYFSRSKQSTYYFFNKYDALLRINDEPDKDRGQTFFINKGSGITLKESFNLLQGRAVFKSLTSKTGVGYQSWLQLNFGAKNSYNNYPFIYVRPGRFDLEKALEKHPIREMSFENLRGNLIRSLQRGNLHPVIFDHPDRTERAFIEANPAKDTINIYPVAMGAGDRTGEGREAPQDADGEGAQPVPHMVLEEEAFPAPHSKASPGL